MLPNVAQIVQRACEAIRAEIRRKRRTEANLTLCKGSGASTSILIPVIADFQHGVGAMDLNHRPPGPEPITRQFHNALPWRATG